MTRRPFTPRSLDTRLDALDEQRRESGPNEWHALLDLPPSSSHGDGWQALLRGDGGEDAWRGLCRSYFSSLCHRC